MNEPEQTLTCLEIPLILRQAIEDPLLENEFANSDLFLIYTIFNQVLELRDS